MKQSLAPQDLVRSWSEKSGIELPSKRLDLLLEMIEWAAPAAARLGLTKYDSAADYTQHLVLPSLALAQIAPEGIFQGPGPGQ